MDMETQGLVNRLEEKLDRRFDQLEVKLDKHTEMIHAQDLRIQTAAQRAETANVRISSHKQEHTDHRKWWLGLLGSLVVLWLMSIWNWLKGSNS